MGTLAEGCAFVKIVERRCFALLFQRLFLLEDGDKAFIDPETLELTRLTAQVLKELMDALQRPGALSDLTLLTQVEDASRLAGDMLAAQPAREEEE